MALVEKEIAQTDINSWLDYKRIDESKREDQKDAIKVLVNAVSEGTLIMNEDKTFTQKLKFPPEGETPMLELIYKPRLKVATIHLHLNGVKSSDADGRLMAHVCALTGKPKAAIQALDTEDYSIASSIAVFFL